MKKALVLAVLFLGINSAFGQAQVSKGDKKVQVGFRAFGYGTGITGTFDYGVNNWFSFGAGTDFYFSGDEDFFLYGRTNFHLGELLEFNDNIDLYPGIDVGFSGDGIGLGARLGFRYFFTDKVGAYVEVGSHGALGVVFDL
ncbi:MAG: hypothetical protein H6604_08515 [Flavobacteriales bacterium]|nr:hypothetical protein [Flavobacteriales bacterium]